MANYSCFLSLYQPNTCLKPEEPSGNFESFINQYSSLLLPLVFELQKMEEKDLEEKLKNILLQRDRKDNLIREFIKIGRILLAYDLYGAAKKENKGPEMLYMREFDKNIIEYIEGDDSELGRTLYCLALDIIEFCQKERTKTEIMNYLLKDKIYIKLPQKLLRRTIDYLIFRGLLERVKVRENGVTKIKYIARISEKDKKMKQLYNETYSNLFMDSVVRWGIKVH